MKRLLPWLWMGLAGALALMLAACDVPAPPPELGTPTPVGGRHMTPTPPLPTPTTAPDGGGTIWFVRGGTLWAAGPSGEHPTQRSPRKVDSVPVPAPDGRLVAFISDQQVIVLDMQTGAERTVATGAMAPDQRLGW